MAEMEVADHERLNFFAPGRPGHLVSPLDPEFPEGPSLVDTPYRFGICEPGVKVEIILRNWGLTSPKDNSENIKNEWFFLVAIPGIFTGFMVPVIFFPGRSVIPDF